MKGDFTRGHNPDLQRAKRYRRVLLQQGRVLLDSDHAATMGAMDRNLRELGQDLGCAAGGSDYGFLLTPGKLYALFNDLDHVRSKQNVELERDYQLKYLNRYPSLHIEGTADGGFVEIELFTPHAGGELVLWCRGEIETAFTVQDGPPTVSVLAVAPAGSLVAVTVTLPATTSVRIAVGTGDHVWIAMIESREDKPEPSFWLSPGRFHFGGLIFDNPELTPWPQQAFPAELGFAVTSVSDRAGQAGFFVAYIEGWERLHTHLHDRGIREEALGGLDTTVRTEAVGQVKLLWVANQPELLALRTALARPFAADGTLAISVEDAIDDPDPCALPVEGGYSGPDNRLYHFEVHVGGPLGQAQFKWSRDNGSELYRVAAITGTIVHIAPGTGLQDGDLVELISDIVELGDAVEAQYDGATFTPAVRSVGQLALLQRDGDGVDDLGRETFKLITLDSGAPLDPDPARYPDDQRMLLRRWHGLFTSPVDPNVAVELEHGIGIELGGTQFVVGDWWEWQARVLLDNDNGQFQTSPHGPERLFAPLAVLQNDTNPLVLRAWADHRFVGLCDLDADHIPFDGTAFASNADTVQEALVELYEHTGFFQATNCCGLEFRPDPFSEDSDDVRLTQLLLAALPNGGTVCFEKGIYVFDGTFDLGILNGNLTIKAGNDVVIVQTTFAPLFRVPIARVLQLEGAVLYSGADLLSPQAQPISQVRLDGHRAVLDARGCMFLMLGANMAVVFDGASVVTPPPIGGILQSIAGNQILPQPNADVLLRDCVLIAHQGIRCANLGRLLLDRVTISAASVAVTAQHIGQLEARHSTLTGILPLDDDALALMNPSTVLGYRHVLADFAQDLALANLAAGADDSFALLTRFIHGGTMTDCRLAAATAIFADLMTRVRISDSRLYSRRDGVWVNQAEQAVFSGLDVVASSNGGRGIAIHVYAHDTTIERCRIETPLGSGIQVAAQPTQPGVVIDIVGLRIVDNQVLATTDGITVGRILSVPNILGLLISGNKVSLPPQGPSSWAIGVFRSAPSPDQGVLVSGNVTSGGDFGIRVRGSRISVVGNNVTVFQIATGLRIDAGVHDLIHDNTITCRNPSEDESITGIEISGHDRVSVSGNIVSTEPAFGVDDPVSRPLNMESCEHVSISGNIFRSGTCRVSDCTDVESQGNRFDRGIEFVDCTNGSMIGNHVERTFSWDGNALAVESLLARNVQGTWNVSNNTVSGNIRVLPFLNFDALLFFEVPYSTIIGGNHARRIQAGRVAFAGEVAPFDTLGAIPHNSSVVMIMGNLGQGILVNNYVHMVVVNNVAPLITSNIPNQELAKIDAPNIRI